MKKREVLRELNILKITVNYLKNNGYTWLIRVNDKFLSNWELAGIKTHVSIIACESHGEALQARSYFINERGYTYFNCYPLTYENVYKIIGKHSYSLTNEYSAAKIASNIEPEIEVHITNGETHGTIEGLNLGEYVDILNAGSYGFREYNIINNLKSFYKGHTWNDNRKTIVFEDVDGNTFMLDLVTKNIVQ